MLVADDQRFDTIAALGLTDAGCRGLHTPHMDALARDGVAFTSTHMPGGTCGAVCMPSRAMFLTSRTSFHLQGVGEGIPSEHTMLPEHFRAAGYETHGIGKWHNGRESFARSFSSGDEIFFGGMTDHWNVNCYRFDPTGRYQGQLPIVEDYYRQNKVRMRDGDHVSSGVHSTDLFCDAAMRFLRGREGNEQPFFLYTSFLAPHDPRTMPEQYRVMYDPEQIELPANFVTGQIVDMGNMNGRDERLAAHPRDPAEIRRHLAEYFAMITHMDDAIGRIRACLEQTGQWENTILVHMADHGLALGQHGLMGKQNLYDHSVRIPLLMTGPGLPRNMRRDEWIYHMDVYPTLCELAGLSRPASVEGQSLCRTIRGESTGRDRLYFAFKDGIRAVKLGGGGRYKLIEYHINGRRDTQVFDIEKDPLEMVNLSGDLELVGRLRKELVKMRDEWEELHHEVGQRFWAGMEF